MTQFVLVFIGLSFHFAVAKDFAFAELPSTTRHAVDLKLGEVQRAQAALMERTVEFNRQEQVLQKVLSEKAIDFQSGLDSLGLVGSERQELEQWHQAQDFKRLSTFARKRLLHIYSRNAFDRETWERFFTSPTPAAFQGELRAFHQSVAEQSRERAAVQSQSLGISLKKLKTNVQDVEKFCAQIPKGGILHTHPYGTMDRATVKKILAIFDPLVDKQAILKYLLTTTERIHPREVDFLEQNKEFYEQPQKYSSVLKQFPRDAEKIVDFFFVPRDTSLFSEGVTPFSRFLAAFALPLEMLGILNGNIDTQIALERIIYDDMFLRNLSQGVFYIEITRSLPVLQKSRQFSDRYNELLRWTEATTSLAPRTLLSFNRTNLNSDEKRLAQVSTMTQLLKMEPSDYVVGVNLMGDEGLTSALDAAQFIYGKLLVENRSRSTGLHATIHAGELGDERNLRDALVFGVERIGHGIQLLENPLYLELARRQGIALEISLSSNEVLQVASIAKNPFLYFHRLGVPVSLSTDDEGMFLTDPNSECELAILQTDMEYSELKEMLLNSLKTSFADEALKKHFLQKLNRSLLEFEQNWKSESL